MRKCYLNWNLKDNRKQTCEEVGKEYARQSVSQMLKLFDGMRARVWRSIRKDAGKEGWRYMLEGYDKKVFGLSWMLSKAFGGF